MQKQPKQRVQTSAPNAQAAVLEPVEAEADGEALAQDLALAAIAGGLNGPPSIPVGNHQARGMAMIAVDAWVSQAAAGAKTESFPYKEVLGLALGLACPGQDKLLRLMARATEKALAEGKVDLAGVAVALDAMKAKFLDRLERRPVKGRCQVTGQVRLIDFREKK